MKEESLITAIVISLMVTIINVNSYAETHEKSFSVETDKLIIEFSETGAYPVLLTSYYPSRNAAQTSSTFTTPKDSALLRILVNDDAVLNKRLRSLWYQLKREESDQSIIMHFTSEELVKGVYFEKTYTIAKHDYLVEASFRICGDNAERFIKDREFQIATGYGKRFMPKSFSGFSGYMEKLRWIHITENKVSDLSEVLKANHSYTLEKSQWAGYRNRFWTFLIQPKEYNLLAEKDNSIGDNELCLTLPDHHDEYLLCIYAGPVEYVELKRENLKLSRLIFTHVWFWMRWLCFGMLFLLNFLIRLVTNHGIAIILLSVSVKIIMLPLVKIAEKWQQEVNEKKSMLQPFIDELKNKYKGEEQNRRILELYRQHKISPLFTLKSLFSALIQIPFFIAAYDMLSENIALRGVGFLWIEDLSLPDRLLQLPFYIPFFGEHLNVLPFAMTGITLLTSRYFRDVSLSKSLLIKQRRNLYIMAVLFFILFYTFPAGMVLYWTTNNSFTLIKTVKRNKHSGLLK